MLACGEGIWWEIHLMQTLPMTQLLQCRSQSRDSITGHCNLPKSKLTRNHALPMDRIKSCTEGSSYETQQGMAIKQLDKTQGPRHRQECAQHSGLSLNWGIEAQIAASIERIAFQSEAGNHPGRRCSSMMYWSQWKLMSRRLLLSIKRSRPPHHCNVRLLLASALHHQCWPFITWLFCLFA